MPGVPQAPGIPARSHQFQRQPLRPPTTRGSQSHPPPSQGQQDQPPTTQGSQPRPATIQGQQPQPHTSLQTHGQHLFRNAAGLTLDPDVIVLLEPGQIRAQVGNNLTPMQSAPQSQGSQPHPPLTRQRPQSQSPPTQGSQPHPPPAQAQESQHEHPQAPRQHLFRNNIGNKHSTDVVVLLMPEPNETAAQGQGEQSAFDNCWDLTVNGGFYGANAEQTALKAMELSHKRQMARQQGTGSQF